MPQKKNEKKNAKSGGGFQDNDQKLQAIVLADSFKRTFAPIDAEKPTALLPLVNAPMLEYTLEFLVRNNVKEIFVFCASHASTIRKYVEASKWPSVVTVRVIASQSCESEGDALREIDNMGIIRSDPFILTSGDVVSNMDLADAIQFHQSKRKNDPMCIMTVCMRPAERTAGTRPILDDLVVSMDANTNQVLLFENDYSKREYFVPPEICKDHPQQEVSTTLLDCYVDICSPELLLQFSDNFDYQSIRRNFLANEVLNFELGMHIYGYRLPHGEYAARIHDPRSHQQVSLDILRRWVAPFVPEAQLFVGCNRTYIKHHGNHIYTEPDVQVHPSALLEEGVYIGRGTVVGAGALLRGSVIGRNCRVGAEAVVIDAQLWDEVHVEEKAQVLHSVVTDGCSVGRAAVISRGSILSFDTSAAAGATLPPFTRLTRHTAAAEEEKETSGLRLEKSSSSRRWSSDGTDMTGGFGPLVRSVDDEDEKDQDQDQDEEKNGEFLAVPPALQATALGCWEAVGWKLAMARHRTAAHIHTDGSAPSVRPSVQALGAWAGESLSAESERVLSTGFEEAVAEVVSTGYARHDDAPNVLMEIKSLKFAQNKSFPDCLKGAVPPILVAAGVSTLSGMALAKSLQQMLGADGWGCAIIAPLVHEESHMICLIELLERVALEEASTHTFRPLFRIALQLLFDEDVLTDAALLHWAAEREEGHGSPESLALFNHPQVRAFVEWLRQDDTSSASDSGSGSSSEGDGGESD